MEVSRGGRVIFIFDIVEEWRGGPDPEGDGISIFTAKEEGYLRTH
jgi:hypothetical protein